MDTIQKLFEIESIKQMKAKYYRCLDTKDWEGCLDCYVEDTTLEFDSVVSTHGAGKIQGHKLQGKQEIADLVVPDLTNAQSVHQLHFS